jgi:hypothetical protein
MAKHEETTFHQHHSTVVDVEPKADAVENTPVSAPKVDVPVIEPEPTPEPAPEPATLVVYFVGNTEPLVIPVTSQDEGIKLMNSIEEQRRGFVSLDINGASAILNPAHIVFMRVENHPGITLQD